MSPDIGNEPTPSAQYTLYDVLSPAPKSAMLAEFDALTGGDQTISMVTYNIIDEKGMVTTRFMPGQTTFSPIQLLRPMDLSSAAMYQLLSAAILGKCVRKNYSVSMNDSQGNPVAWWNLYNALPTKLDGFSFNGKIAGESGAGVNYTDFEITFQAEAIDITFP
jgi:phage tail-like protein